MIKIPAKNLDPDISASLTKLQSKIDKETSFEKKAKKAQLSWDSKNKTIFGKVSQALLSMNVANGVCNYCEQNESNDIEHIKPKSFFPAHTFDWENFILACKQCNSGHKVDKCYVFDQQNNLVFLERDIEPASSDVAFINPRKDDPNKYMILNMEVHKFDLLPSLTPIEEKIATKTIEILQLNNRDVLIEARKNAEAYYFNTLDRLVHIRSARSKKALKAILSPVDHLIDDTLPLKKLKSEITESYKNHLITYQHPSVWYGIRKIQSIVNPLWKALFTKLPEALNWE